MRDLGVATAKYEFVANATCVAGVVQIYRFNNSVASVCANVCLCAVASLSVTVSSDCQAKTPKIGERTRRAAKKSTQHTNNAGACDVQLFSRVSNI